MRDQLVGVGLDGVGEAQQRAGAGRRAGRRPLVEGGGGGVDGAVDVGGVRRRHLGDRLARGRVDHGVGATLDRVDPRATDEVRAVGW